MPDGNVELVIEGRPRDLGGFSVRRVLPWSRRRMVGPFIFFDAMGPTVLGVGQGVDVRPHPHIGLSTVTYLFTGELLHRDSLGSVQTIRPGEVNWMTAGRGIVHSERTAPAERAREKPLFGIQVWVALPREVEECAPSFSHTAREALPEAQLEGCVVRLILGDFAGLLSPVAVTSPTLYAEATLAAGAALTIPGDVEERAVYVAEGAVACGSGTLAAGSMAVFGAGEASVRAVDGPARVMLIGGERLEGDRFIEWNFVASSQERIEQAKADWVNGRFDRIPGETEFIPLPGVAPGEATYYP